MRFVAAPSASPANVRGKSTSSTSIFVQWDQVPPSYQNGVILYYTVTYRLRYQYRRFSQRVVVAAPTTQTTLTGLNQGTPYSISVSASTSKGRGPSTDSYVSTGKNSDFPFSLFDFNGEKEIATMKMKRKPYAHIESPKGRAQMAML